jgi:prepilin signal peptidase PulO-like enzyme (type II secretory pathway)
MIKLSMPEQFTNEIPDKGMQENPPENPFENPFENPSENDSTACETSLSTLPSTAAGTHNRSKKRRFLSKTMLFRRIRWWAWVYLWVGIGLITLSGFMVGGSSVAYLRDGRGFSSSIDVNDFLICRGFEWLLGMWVFIVGCCIASFLNVVAYRLPAGLPVTGHSFCPYCRVPIEKRDNFPVLGWIHLQGRCRSCHIRISPRYPIFEAIGGLLLLSIFVSTILSHGANLPSVHQQVMPYGLPVNLRLMESIVFAFAFLHGWLLLILFTAALTHYANGKLPIWVWGLGIAVTLIAIGMTPDLVILPINRPMEITPSETDDHGHHLISRSIAAATVAIGMTVSIFLGFATFLLQRNASRESMPTTPISMWLGSCLMIGTALGYQAVAGILLLNMLIRFAIHLTTTLVGFWTKPVERFLAFGPIGTLWISTAIWLAAWRPIHSAFRELWQTMFS